MGQQESNGEHFRINGQEHTTNEDNPRDNTGTCPSTEERLDADDDESTVTALMEEIIKSRMNLMDPSFDKATDMHPTKKDLRMEQGGDKTETVNGSALQLDDSVPPPHLRRQRALYETLSPGAIAVPGAMDNNVTNVTVHDDNDSYHNEEEEDQQQDEEQGGGLPTYHATLVHDEEVVHASALDTTEQEAKSKRHQMTACIGAVTIIAGLVAVVVTAMVLRSPKTKQQQQQLSISPSLSPTHVLGGLYTIVALNPDFPAETTAQYEALQWLSDNSNSAEYSKEELRQRYSLATLLYSNLKYTNQAPDSLSNKSHCTWSGIECRNEKGAGNMQVIGIHGTLLKPTTDSVLTIPPELALLSNSLQYLQFPNTTLEGTFPSELGRLTELKLLEFSANPDITQGQLFSEIGRLHQLEKLSLHNCGLTGALPTEIGQITSLCFWI